MPYKILERIGQVAYKIELPKEAQIHQVFHISQIKIYYQDNTLHPATLPIAFIEGQWLVNPIKILKQRQLLREG